MLSNHKILLLLPLLVLSCLLISYIILYASSEKLYPVVAQKFDLALTATANQIWPPSSSSAADLPPSSHPKGPEKEEGLSLPELRALCTRIQWDRNLAVHCHSRCGRNQTSFCGGINNARDRLQTCLRLGIDAGATTIVIPSLAARSEKRIATINPAAVAGAEDQVVELCADAWFDMERLQEALGEHCPQTRIKFICPPTTDESAARLVGADRVLEVPWRSLGESKYDTRTGHTFREAVEDVFSLNNNNKGSNNNNASSSSSKKADKPPAASNRTLVQVGDTYTAWDYTISGEQTNLFKDLFQTVAFSPTLRALGQRIITQHPLLLRDEAAYIGVHLRGENDWPAEWGSLDVQTSLYAGDIETLRLRDEARGLSPVRNIYVSCGNRTSIEYFRERVEPLGYTVLDKWSLLLLDNESSGWPEGMETIEALSFDEKAIVEYEPLVNSRYFLGISYSSMSYVIATARTLAEPGDFWEAYITSGGGGGGGVKGEEEESKGITEVRGNEHTRLIYVNIE